MKLGFLAFLLCFSVAAHAAGNILKCKDEQSGQVSDKTKLLKTYTREYWQIAQREIVALPQVLKKTGFVAGDFHFNNAGIYYDYSRNRAEFQINDFDDAGRNFLIGDFFKYITFVNKLDKTIDLRPLFSAYIAGLKKQEVSPPAEIEAVLHRSQLDFNKDNRKYIENLREEISNFDKSTIDATVMEKVVFFKQLKLIRQMTDMDFMVQRNDSGSSINALRVQFIGTDQNGVTGSIEFKQMKCSATGNPLEQDVESNFSFVKSFISNFYPGNPVTQQFAIRLDNENYFLVREKRKNFLKKVNLESLAADRLNEVAAFYANYLGRVHSFSADISYTEAVSTHIPELILKAKDIAKKFKDEVKN